MKHTPGSWRFERTNLNDNRTLLYEPNDRVHIIEITHNEANRSETLANAKLISSSPDMLNVLVRIVSEFKGQHINDFKNAKQFESIVLAESLIKKATK